MTDITQVIGCSNSSARLSALKIASLYELSHQDNHLCLAINNFILAIAGNGFGKDYDEV